MYRKEYARVLSLATNSESYRSFAKQSLPRLRDHKTLEWQWMPIHTTKRGQHLPSTGKQDPSIGKGVDMRLVR